MRCNTRPLRAGKPNGATPVKEILFNGFVANAPAYFWTERSLICLRSFFSLLPSNHRGEALWTLSRTPIDHYGPATFALLTIGWAQVVPRSFYFMAGHRHSHAWRRVAGLLSSEYDVVVPDLPGFGYTSKPDAGFDKKTIARRLREFAHGLGLSQVALAGHDLGGHVAYAYAAQWPNEVNHLIIIESSLPSFGQEEAMDVSKGGSWHFGFNMAGDISEELVRGREKLFVDHFMRREKVGLFDSNSVSDADIEVYARASAAWSTEIVVQLLPHVADRSKRQFSLGTNTTSNAGSRDRD